MRVMMTMLAALGALGALGALDSAKADPYRWCAEYGGRSGATNCYFMTLGQCQATVSGVGGFCRPNTFYTGSDGGPRRKRRHR
jgi:hypothetical protein